MSDPRHGTFIDDGEGIVCVYYTNLSLIIETFAVPKSIQLWRRNSAKKQGLAVMPATFKVTRLQWF